MLDLRRIKGTLNEILAYVLTLETENVNKLILGENLVEKVGLALGCEERVQVGKEKGISGEETK